MMGWEIEMVQQKQVNFVRYHFYLLNILSFHPTFCSAKLLSNNRRAKFSYATVIIDER